MEGRKIKSLPIDAYQIALAVACSYPDLLKRRGKLDPEREARNEAKIRAVEDALSQLVDDTERKLIEKNIMQGIRMQYIDLPISIRSMKRTRKRFIRLVAKNLKEA